MLKMIIEKATHYCRSILQNVSRSFALTIPMVEKNIMVPILLGYLEARIMDNFEDENAGKSIENKKRVKYIKKTISVIQNPESLKSKRNMEDIARAAADFVSNPHYLNLAQNMNKVMVVHKTMDKHAQKTISLWYGRMAEGMQKYLSKRIDTFQHLDEYCYYVAGTVAGMFTDLIVKNAENITKQQEKILRIKQNHFGLLLQKVNIIRDFRQDIINNEKIFWPHNLFREHDILPHEAINRMNEAKSMVILKKMIGQSKKHITHVKKYISNIPQDFPGFRNAAIINILLGVETLAKIKNNPDVFYSKVPVKVDKSVAKNIISNPMEAFQNMRVAI